MGMKGLCICVYIRTCTLRVRGDASQNDPYHGPHMAASEPVIRVPGIVAGVAAGRFDSRKHDAFSVHPQDDQT